MGYEPRPFFTVQPDPQIGTSLPPPERLNNEGFRGPEYSTEKPNDLFRILAIGNSVVQGFSVSYLQTWEKVLEEELNRYAESQRDAYARYEIINAGVGGYVSWQALARLKGRGLKYQPDLVLILVGWNDMVYSTLSYWKPGLDLTQIEQMYAYDPQNQAKKGLWAKIRLPIYRISHLARLIREARNRIWNALRIRDLIRQRQYGSGLAFNEEALTLYLQNLERIYQTLKKERVRMGLVTWPTLLAPDFLRVPDFHLKLAKLHYGVFPLSTSEYWSWYTRYQDAQRKFASLHPDILLIDAAEAFASYDKQRRLSLFIDLTHLTPEGNRELAKKVLRRLLQSGAVKSLHP